ncbi:MAG: DNA polymerase III subunit delta [Lachnospiraceae bacterium]|nr:DNA polymerase III subunit delta [Lachnospiraceae bacterium]
MQKIKQDLKDGALERVYLIWGPEAYLRRSLKQSIRQSLVGDDEMNYTYREGREIDPAEIRGIAETVPFFAPRRLIVLENTGLFSKGGEEMAELLPDIPPETVLVFVEEEADKRSKLYKAVLKNGYAAECRKMKDEELERFVLAGFRRRKVPITREALDLFLERCGDDLDHISAEQEKLAAYVYGRDGIRPEDVEAVTSVTLQNRVFDMLDAVAFGRPEKAFVLYRDLKALREPPMRILYLLTQQVNRLLQVKEDQARGLREESIAESLGVRTGAVRKYAAQARAFSAEKLAARVEKLVALDTAVKTGELEDEAALELALAEFAGNHDGEAG